MGSYLYRTLLVATSNLHKADEIKEILHLDHFLTLKDFPHLPIVEENGTSFRSNAILKARYYAQATQLLTLADDSGLSIDCIQGRPGIHSARYGGVNTSYAEKNQMLLKELAKIPWESRTANFSCVAALISPEGKIWVRQGKLNGIIAYEAKGEFGFGYDPIFYLPKFKKNLAELPPELKNSLSHRYIAFKKIATILKALDC